MRPLPLPRRFARLLVLACLFLAAAAPVERRATIESSGEGASAAGEVRLRKLHLVRPDLIPYPIAYEVCC
jgi:hypothetical protein